MSAFKRFFSGVTDTGEKAKEERFRTRFYRGEQKKVCHEVVTFAKNERDLKVVHVNDSRGEVMIEYRNPLGIMHDLVVTVYAVTPVQSAVDMHAAVRSRFVDPGFNSKLISRIYNYLDRELTNVRQ